MKKELERIARGTGATTGGAKRGGQDALPDCLRGGGGDAAGRSNSPTRRARAVGACRAASVPGDSGSAAKVPTEIGESGPAIGRVDCRSVESAHGPGHGQSHLAASFRRIGANAERFWNPRRGRRIRNCSISWPSTSWTTVGRSSGFTSNSSCRVLTKWQAPIGPRHAESILRTTFGGGCRPRRLDAESIRDALLVISGQLDASRGEAHPFPLVETWAFNVHHPFKEIYPSNRRSIYLMTQRIQKHPFLGLFDGRSRRHDRRPHADDYAEPSVVCDERSVHARTIAPLRQTAAEH